MALYMYCSSVWHAYYTLSTGAADRVAKLLHAVANSPDYVDLFNNYLVMYSSNVYAPQSMYHLLLSAPVVYHGRTE